jgi:hypothetical protein
MHDRGRSPVDYISRHKHEGCRLARRQGSRVRSPRDYWSPVSAQTETDDAVLVRLQ